MTLNINTAVFSENENGGLLICGINHGLTKQDEKDEAMGIDRSESRKSFFSDYEVNDYPLRNKLVNWFSLWGFDLQKEAPAGAFERSISQCNWLESQSNNMREVNTYELCVSSPEPFVKICARLKPSMIIFLSQELLWAMNDPRIVSKFQAIYGDNVEEPNSITKEVAREVGLYRKFNIWFQKFGSCQVISVPHPTSSYGLSNAYIASFKTEIGGLINQWWESHKSRLRIDEKEHAEIPECS